MPQEDSKKLFKGAFILTVAAAITKILSAVYRVPFQNIVGDVGFYIYQQIYPIYGVAIALATYGFPVIISKFVAEGNSENNSNVKQMMKSIFLLLSSMGIILFLLFFIGAPYIAGLMGDSKLFPLIRTIAFSFLLVPFISIIRGFFQGIGNMLPTAISQVTEQFIRVASILLLTFFLIRRGYSLYVAGEGALIGSVVGGLVSLFVLVWFMIRFRNKHPLPVGNSQVILGNTFLLQGLAICISGMMLVLFQLVDSLNIYALLTKSGVSIGEAKSLKGIYDRGQPLLQLGTIVATSMSLTLVPLISGAFKNGDLSTLKEKVGIALKISIIVGIGSTIGLINIIHPTNIMLFKNDHGSIVLAVFSVSILFSSIILTITGIFQGIGLVYVPAIYMLIGVIVKLLGNQVLVPKLGTLGASIATILSLAIISGFFMKKLIKLKLGKLPILFYVKVLISALIMTGVLQIWLICWGNILAFNRLSSVFLALSGVMIGGAAYIISIMCFKLFTKEDVDFIPFGEKLFRIFSSKER
ncbi:MAG: putative polysaccharide biosynthesis protein [Heyndrickxia sp.]